MDEHERNSAAYREAKSSIAAHRVRQADAEKARTAWLRTKRGVPPHMLYGPDGEPTDPQLVALETDIVIAKADVEWCRGLVVACGEKVKGVAFADVPNGPRPDMAEIVQRMGVAVD